MKESGVGYALSIIRWIGIPCVATRESSATNVPAAIEKKAKTTGIRTDPADYRISGSALDRFNDAKRAEVEDRVKHAVSGTLEEL